MVVVVVGVVFNFVGFFRKLSKWSGLSLKFRGISELREAPDNESLIKQGGVLSSSYPSPGLIVVGSPAVHIGSAVAGTTNAQSVLVTF